ncbi:GDSL-type esterase/lipase family protein [Aetokthonos hydrillicola Thurmond2011]|jgi:lysophospholipase L1-like esterase|uniref:GDSL-type esterase/lipase family protein n=1 Tax=Aetokthonos hydrillicola Thurmond2011 TaxID=2712845 RepID=A0AAP5IGU9_9CYAN|nr:GDSL-type esterase/lipase family protein [Aetokthonos hydrillicola]MBO3461864.1 G-D-S-L family lipolytic protein [Aetokthonos hydrillicola CCALA 1050]MBW4588896.1 G-D-S-L family lipolytic protein [Aetokthonos hydrillicola CCALA 1050]MDR9900922.1 GDSL-type esterase/lipase family protein [Aetokthonos hydrillicola Thurmond2011]
MQALEKHSVKEKSVVSNLRQPLKIVALGDSLVYGFGDPEGGGWVEQLRRWWMLPDSAGHIIYNLGVRGDRTHQVAERLEVEFRHRGELRNRVPDLIILSVGVNDSARVGRPNGKNYTDFKTFESQITSLLERAQQLCPVLFVGMVPVDEAKMPFLDCLYYNHTDQYCYKEATKLACVKREIPYLDIFQQWMDRGETWRLKRMSNDGLHPNTLGYKALLEDVINWDALAPYNFNIQNLV